MQRIGRELAGRFPSPARHPVRSLDQKAMQLTAQDAELGAALFRLVDVTPACRSVDDLSAHLVAYLDQVPERPPSIEAAMRLAGNRAGPAGARRRDRGRRPAHGAPLHRRRVATRRRCGRSPHSGARGSPAPSTCSARRR